MLYDIDQDQNAAAQAYNGVYEHDSVSNINVGSFINGLNVPVRPPSQLNLSGVRSGGGLDPYQFSLMANQSIISPRPRR